MANKSNGNGAAKAETIDQIASRFSQRTDGATTLREMFAYADNSVCFGNGQFPHVPAHFEATAIDQRLARLALALDVARGGANNFPDDSLGEIVAKAESALSDGSVMPSLLEEAVDNYFYKLQKMEKSEKQSQGITAVMRNMSSFKDRTAPVERILSYAVTGEKTTVPAGFPKAGKLWADVIAEEIVEYVSTQVAKNKKEAKKAADKPEAAKDKNDVMSNL